VGRTLLSVAVDFDFDLRCYPEEAESHAKRATPDWIGKGKSSARAALAISKNRSRL
jgi:hypothetical protein